MTAKRRQKLAVFREIVMVLSLFFIVLYVLFFLVAMHFLIVAIVPATISATLPTLIVTVTSIAIGVLLSLPALSGESRRMSASLIFFTIYAVSAILASRLGDFPGIYTLPYALFGIVGTTFMFTDFAAIVRFFENIERWRSRRDRHSADFLTDEIIEFDRRIRSLTITVITMGFILIGVSAAALAAAGGIAVGLLVLVAVFLFSGTLIVTVSRIIVRLKTMFVAGHDVDERHFVRPLAYTLIATVTVVIIGGALASDYSPLNYSIFTRALERIFNVSESDQPAFSSTDTAAGFSDAPAPITEPVPPHTGGAEAASGGLRVLLIIVRYVLLGLALLAGFLYIVFYLLRVRREESPSFAVTNRRRKNRRAKLILLRIFRIWRVLSLSLRGLFGRRSRTVRPKIDTHPSISASQGTDTWSRRERNSMLRWYRKLVTWGERHDIPSSRSSTAREFTRQIIYLRPDLKPTLESIAETFDESFYSPVRIGRIRVRRYIHDVRAITKS